MELLEIIDLIDAVSIPKEANVTQLRHEEDSEFYMVWRIDTDNAQYILKEAKGNEKELYTTVLSDVNKCVPILYQFITIREKTYLLLEYIEGEDLRKCNRTKLIHALDALIYLQEQTWEIKEVDSLKGSFDKSFLQCKNRGKYLNDSQLEMAYENFLSIYRSIPRTLCHGDFLPFNVITGNEKTALIDWECGGILPYPVAFARLIAHTEEARDAFFYMTSSDKRFAIDYYYDNLLKKKGIEYISWLNTLEYFLFYEYCEWVFVGNKYNKIDGKYYQKYLPIAKQQAGKLLEIDAKL